jgi:O-antigen/teichoic acid export membrane protein
MKVDYRVFSGKKSLNSVIIIGDFMRCSGSRIILIGQVVAGVMSFLALAVTVNYVGARVFGFCSIFILILNIAITLVDFGACSWASREYAAQNISLGTFKNVMLSKTKLNLLFVLVIPVFFTESLREFKFAFLLLFYPMLWNRSNYIQQFLLARNLTGESVFLILIDRACWLLIIPMSVINLDRTLAFTLPITVGLLLQNIFFSMFMSRKRFSDGDVLYYKQTALFRFSKKFGTIGASGVISNFDGFLVAWISSIAESSSYLLAQRFRNPLTIVFTSISMHLRPIAAKRDTASTRAALRSDVKLMAFSVLSTLVFASLVLIFSGELLGPEFKGASMILFFGVITSIPLGTLILTSSLLSSMGVESYVAKVNSIYSIKILLGVTFGTLFFGSLGAVLTGLLITLIYALIFGIRLRRELEIAQ